MFVDRKILRFYEQISHQKILWLVFWGCTYILTIVKVII